MTVTLEGTKLTVSDDATPLATAKLYRTSEDVLILTDLESMADAGAVRALVRFCVDFAKGETLFAAVGTSNPKHDKLVEHYKALGMVEEHTMLRLDPTAVE